MSAGRLDIFLEGGEDTPVTFTWKINGSPVNLTNYTGKMQIRQISGGTLVLEKKTSDGSMTLGGVAGTITFTITAANTTTLISTQNTSRVFYWDLILTSGSNVPRKLLKGRVTVDPNITV